MQKRRARKARPARCTRGARRRLMTGPGVVPSGGDAGIGQQSRNQFLHFIVAAPCRTAIGLVQERLGYRLPVQDDLAETIGIEKEMQQIEARRRGYLQWREAGGLLAHHRGEEGQTPQRGEISDCQVAKPLRCRRLESLRGFNLIPAGLAQSSFPWPVSHGIGGDCTKHSRSCAAWPFAFILWVHWIYSLSVHRRDVESHVGVTVGPLVPEPCDASNGRLAWCHACVNCVFGSRCPAYSRSYLVYGCVP
jgi:hypothetical protein